MLFIAHSQTPQLSPRFSKTSQSAKMFFLPASLLKVTKRQPSSGKLVVCPEAYGSDLFKAEGG